MLIEKVRAWKSLNRKDPLIVTCQFYINIYIFSNKNIIFITYSLKNSLSQLKVLLINDRWIVNILYICYYVSSAAATVYETSDKLLYV